jgi:rRNA-processing protein CGR1
MNVVGAGNLKNLKKSTQKTKHLMTVDLPQIRKGFQRMQEMRAEIAAMKDIQTQFRREEEELQKEIRRRRLQKKLAKEENRRKSEKVQIVSNPSKLKRMSKSELRKLRRV